MSELPAMKWLIFGCGGVGGYFGARIAQVKGQRVSYIAACQQVDLPQFPVFSQNFPKPVVISGHSRLESVGSFAKVRNKALSALKEHGVRITSICGDVQIPASQLGPVLDSQVLDKEEKFVADVIMLGCKASEAEGCLKQCEPWCGPETLILPLQNGVDGLTTIREVVKSWGKGHALAGR